MTERAWTLGYPPAYERAVRIPGNAKAPGGYLFRTREEAVEHTQTHDDAARYQPYEIELPAPYEDVATRSWERAATMRHAWHSRSDANEKGVDFMPECGICMPPESGAWADLGTLDHDLLLVTAPFINPDTGTVVRADNGGGEDDGSTQSQDEEVR